MHQQGQVSAGGLSLHSYALDVYTGCQHSTATAAAILRLTPESQQASASILSIGRYPGCSAPIEHEIFHDRLAGAAQLEKNRASGCRPGRASR